MITNEQALTIDPANIPRKSPWTGAPFSIDDLCTIRRVHEPSPKEAARKQAQDNDLAQLRGEAEHLDNLQRHHSHNKAAVRIARQRLEQAARPFGGIEAAVKAGLIQGAA